jgi:hypothetical protein
MIRATRLHGNVPEYVIFFAVCLTTISVTQTTASNKELERMWKEAVVAQFKVRYYYPGICLEGLRKNTKSLIYDARLWAEMVIDGLSFPAP